MYNNRFIRPYEFPDVYSDFMTHLLNHIDTTTNEELPPLISFSDEIIPDDHSDNKPIPNSNNPTSSSEQWALITDDEG